MKTVLITGCSTGFGRQTALHFLAQGWSVIATMRDPAANTLAAHPHLRVLPLDVTDAASIESAIAAAGPIDVLVNNAGIGWLNALEATPLDMVRTILETNLVAAIAMMQAVLPGMRERGSGVIVNVSSSTTLKPFALLSVYSASKAAMNALTASAALELEAFGIRARVVVPGAAPTTRFGDSARAQIAAHGGFPQAYEAFVETSLAQMRAHATSGAVTTEEDVAQAVLRAATDPDCPMILPAGADAVALAQARRDGVA
ncbi:SDR family NAD(P)-dependent oxidoreductase [Aureimonas frigidaquae]|uniref:SDR family NAD(P)-dependent oxidoreductase n=1 Tax=Aureimonas frigidaquae TaxID=424757 RepID=UPI0007806AAF|nr:SDR family NAD(P)-dependent oxidoreductase [Aureimonas frigidaquae]